jgi:lactate permease
MKTVAAILPIMVVIVTMVALHWSGQRAGIFGWLTAVIVGYAQFGLNLHVFWISQLKGLYLSFFVLAIVWPALLLFHTVRRAGGIQALADVLQGSMQERGLLVVGLAWAFSGMLEGLAGFGLPIAIVAPILIGLGVQPVIAVAAVAIGHSWAVTFGDMGVIFQTLLQLTSSTPAQLVPSAAWMLGLTCLGCGWSTMLVLGQARLGLKILLVALAMASTQYALAAAGIIPLSAFGAGLAGMALLILWGRPQRMELKNRKEFWAVVASYGGLAALLTLVTAINPIQDNLIPYALSFNFPAVKSSLGYETSAVTQTFRYFLHPGFSLILVAVISYAAFRRSKLIQKSHWRKIAVETWLAAFPTSITVLFMVGLSTLMEHTGMMLLLAQTLSRYVGAAFPVISPWIGILGAFATGSNNNSNVMFAALQQNSAILLGLNPPMLIAAQTAGGSLGSMVAPAKLILGCTTAGIKERQGETLRRTLPFGLALGFVLGVGAFFSSR